MWQYTGLVIMKKIVLGSLLFRYYYLHMFGDSLSFGNRSELWPSTEHSVGSLNHLAIVPDT